MIIDCFQFPNPISWVLAKRNYFYKMDLQRNFHCFLNKVNFRNLSFSASYSGCQAASDEEAENCERAFIFQLLASDSSSDGKEVQLLINYIDFNWPFCIFLIVYYNFLCFLVWKILC